MIIDIVLVEISSGIGICDIYIYFLSLLMDYADCFSLETYVVDIVVCLLIGVLWRLLRAKQY